MKINTKYSLGEKVWYYIPHLNKYAWGQVTFIEVYVRLTDILITYEVENRFCKRGEIGYYDYCREETDKRRYKDQYIRLEEKELFTTVKELTANIEAQHRDKMGQLEELERKEGLFGFFSNDAYD